MKGVEPIGEPLRVAQLVRRWLMPGPRSPEQRLRGAAIGGGHTIAVATFATVAGVNLLVATAAGIGVIAAAHAAAKLRRSRIERREIDAGPFGRTEP